MRSERKRRSTYIVRSEMRGDEWAEGKHGWERGKGYVEKGVRSLWGESVKDGHEVAKRKRRSAFLYLG